MACCSKPQRVLSMMPAEHDAFLPAGHDAFHQRPRSHQSIAGKAVLSDHSPRKGRPVHGIHLRD